MSSPPQLRYATPAEPLLLLLDLRGRVGEKVHQGIFGDARKACRGFLPLPSRIASRLRIVAGAMFMMHSLSKLFDWRGGEKEMFSQLWFGGVIELVCGTLVAIGLFTRPAAFLASGTMAVAYIQFHWKVELASQKFFPIVNKGETALLYCFLFLFIAARGAQKWAVKPDA